MFITPSLPGTDIRENCPSKAKSSKGFPPDQRPPAQQQFEPTEGANALGEQSQYP